CARAPEATAVLKRVRAKTVAKRVEKRLVMGAHLPTAAGMVNGTYPRPGGMRVVHRQSRAYDSCAVSLRARVCELCGVRFDTDRESCPLDGAALRDAPDPFVGSLIGGRYLLEERI